MGRFLEDVGGDGTKKSTLTRVYSVLCNLGFYSSYSDHLIPRDHSLIDGPLLLLSLFLSRFYF